MSPEAQRIAIAKAVPNWSPHHAGKYCSVTMQHAPDELLGRLFDPLKDLNAMYQAAKALDAFQWELYREYLAECCTPLHMCHSKEQQFKFAMEATAPQRAEAFLKALGKWDDSK